MNILTKLIVSLVRNSLVEMIKNSELNEKRMLKTTRKGHFENIASKNPLTFVCGSGAKKSRYKKHTGQNWADDSRPVETKSSILLIATPKSRQGTSAVFARPFVRFFFFILCYSLLFFFIFLFRFTPSFALSLSVSFHSPRLSPASCTRSLPLCPFFTRKEK